MAAMEDDVFFDALQKHCSLIESAPLSKCNMKHQVREEARQALGQLKSSIYKNFERVKAANVLEAFVEEFGSIIYQACLHSMPTKKTSKHNVPWWSTEIGCARKRLNASRRRFQRCKNPIVRELYRNKYLDYRKDYNQMLTDAKTDSWKKFLLTIDAQNVWKKVYTYGVKREFMKKIEITGIKLPTEETTPPL
ncbi:reverse transcriptase domain-containing protein [Trichonephila clavata]|uniref:Reverse transcriptase domain-containing protein n=1 Tax=Trichonephila clavata TaxID=2740835 RepID=A0A8X6LHC8_TRICU|nr:reverse transcriptase domain-containing protein [Trichonephila clavata]